jgi:hypothetical protein
VKPTPVEVTWIDSAFDRGWAKLAEKRAMTVARCRTVGYLLDRDDDVIKLVQSLGDADSAADGIAIPRVAVRSIRRLT